MVYLPRLALEHLMAVAARQINSDCCRKMNLPQPSYQLNGDEPPIVGSICIGFYLIQHQIEGSLSDPANSAYFKFNENWVQLCFEGNTIFWRQTNIPGEPINSDLSSVLVLLNLSEMSGVVGVKLETITYWGTETEVGSTLQFASGKKLSFRHLSNRDVTFVTANK